MHDRSSLASCFLVTAANGDLAEAVGGVLADAFPVAERHGTEAGPHWPARLVFDSVHAVPLASRVDYVRTLKSVASEIGADFIVPCNDAEAMCIVDAPELMESFQILLPAAALVKTFIDKLATAQWLRRNNLPGPRTTLLSEATPSLLPLVAKPRFGAGSRGIFTVSEEQQLKNCKTVFGDDYVAQSFLPSDDTEYTCAVFAWSGDFRHLIMRRRLDAGRTVAITVEENAAISEVLLGLAERANLAGILNVQLRVTPSGPRIFEINPRFSSTVKMRHLLGFQDLVWMIQALREDDIDPFVPPRDASVYRLSREVVVSSGELGRMQGT